MQILICENTKTGTKCGRAREINFFAPDGDLILQIESVDLNGEPLRSFDSEEKIISCHDRKFRHNGTQWWVGNMMWNAYEMPDDHALGLINTLHQSRKWSINEGWVEVARAWMKPDEMPGFLFELPGVVPAWVAQSQSALIFK
jgi:hypothetical protein